MLRKAFITGVTGQDGTILSNYLLYKGYDVYGMCRHHATPQVWRLEYTGTLWHPKFHLVSGDLTDYSSLVKLMNEIRPHEVYHLGAMSFVGESFNTPIATCDINAMGTLRLLEAVRLCCPDAKVYIACTSEMFGYENYDGVMNEETAFHPRSPYGVSKVFAYYIGVNYREAYNMFVCNGILFNHESILRGDEFVTQKICQAAANCEKVHLGNVHACRDWGCAIDYCIGMYRMLQQDKPDDYVLATGKTHSVLELCEIAYRSVGLDYRKFLVIDEKFKRPSDVNRLCGDASKAHKLLKWRPTVTFEQLIKEMVQAWNGPKLWAPRYSEREELMDDADN